MIVEITMILDAASCQSGAAIKACKNEKKEEEEEKEKKRKIEGKGVTG